MEAYIESVAKRCASMSYPERKNVLEEIAKMAFANLADFTTIEDGAPYRPVRRNARTACSDQ